MAPSPSQVGRKPSPVLPTEKGRSPIGPVSPRMGSLAKTMPAAGHYYFTLKSASLLAELASARPVTGLGAA